MLKLKYVMNFFVPCAAGKGHLGNSLLCPHHVRGLLSQTAQSIPWLRGTELPVKPLLGCLEKQMLSWRD